jgi:3-phosphoshikimate 1-carboxyvinyltransferase
MNKEIFALDRFPDSLPVAGDYYLTIAAIFLGALADGITRITNFNRGSDIGRAISILKTLGYAVDAGNGEIIIQGGRERPVETGATMEYGGGIYPLILSLGLMTGKGHCCALRYGERVSRSYLTKLVDLARALGIGIDHDPEKRRLQVSPCRLMPIEATLSSSYPFFKVFLLTHGIAGGRSVALREERLSPAYFEKLISKFGGKLARREIKSELVADIRDPRRKIRKPAADYRLEMMLHPSTKLRATEITIPEDSFQAAALITLAILRKRGFSYRNISINRELAHFIDFLKASGVEARIENRRSGDFYKRADLFVQGRINMARKIAGETAFNIQRETPLAALLMAAFPNTTVIRETAEYGELNILPYGEISRNLANMGIKCGVLKDGFVIEGKDEINGGSFGPFQNPEIALAFYLAALAGKGKSVIVDYDFLAEHYPELISLFEETQSVSEIHEKAS